MPVKTARAEESPTKKSPPAAGKKTADPAARWANPGAVSKKNPGGSGAKNFQKNPAAAPSPAQKSPPAEPDFLPKIPARGEKSPAPTRIVFAGSPDFAADFLEILAGKIPGAALVGVVAAPPRPAGRGQKMTPCPVAEVAAARGIPVFCPEKIDAEAIEKIRADFAPDLLVVAAYGKILPAGLLDLPRHGAVNLHFSLLPRWRGASPVQAAILAGDRRTGVCLQKMVFELDAGPIFAEKFVEITPGETAGALLSRLARIGGEILTAEIPRILAGTAPEPQTGDPTFCRKIEKSAGRVDFAADPAAEIFAKFCAFSPWPGIFSGENSDRVIFTEIAPGWGFRAGEPDFSATGEPIPPGIFAIRDGRVLAGAVGGVLEILTVKPAGKREMPAGDFYRK